VNQANRGLVQAYELEPRAEQILLAHSWPGNLRELENVINRACILVDGHVIGLEELPAEMTSRATARAPAASTHAASLREQIQQVEAQIVLRAIGAADGDRRLAAQRLGISLSSLYAKLNGKPSEAAPEKTETGRTT